MTIGLGIYFYAKHMFALCHWLPGRWPTTQTKEESFPTLPKCLSIIAGITMAPNVVSIRFQVCSFAYSLQ